MPPPMILETSAAPKSKFAAVAGAVLLASITSACLYGFTLLLILQYFKSHAKPDPWHLKLTVGILCILVTLITGFLSFQVYDMFITQHGDVTSLNEIRFYVVGQYTCISLTAFITQTFFASRIWRIGKNFGSPLGYAAIPVGILSSLQMSSGLGMYYLYYWFDRKDRNMMSLALLAQVYVLRSAQFFSKLAEHTAYLKVGDITNDDNTGTSEHPV
ncbi:hypothetical protein D9613_004650 [Agrocybe pediades]|uniref:Uncharacterized protein n=1 Tax=Agrocybe pediades TaxID=84607 RepID=A0A8H4VTJ1_9AGAR|nr:hypothetical protein D9613_004650 [Agrocybe pediades]